VNSPRLLDVLEHPDERLRVVSSPVEDVSSIRGLVRDMVHTLYWHRAVGLAAPQVGVPVRLFVLDPAYFVGDMAVPAMVFVNPEIISASDERVRRREGCLSFPGQFLHVTRPRWVVVRALDAAGRPVELSTEGNDLLSQAVQHETDHLDGVLFADRIDERQRRRMARSR